jgi:hypothetical protein
MALGVAAETFRTWHHTLLGRQVGDRLQVPCVVEESRHVRQGDSPGLLQDTALCETARLVGIDPHACLWDVRYAAISTPGAITHPEVLFTPQPA